MGLLALLSYFKHSNDKHETDLQQFKLINAKDPRNLRRHTITDTILFSS